MSKKEIDFEKLGGLKTLKPKKAETKIDAEKAVQSIHSENGKSEEKEKLRRVTIDLPFSVYVDVRKKIVEEERTLRDYFIELARNDLES